MDLPTADRQVWAILVSTQRSYSTTELGLLGNKCLFELHITHCDCLRQVKGPYARPFLGTGEFFTVFGLVEGYTLCYLTKIKSMWMKIYINIYTKKHLPEFSGTYLHWQLIPLLSASSMACCLTSDFVCHGLWMQVDTPSFQGWHMQHHVAIHWLLNAKAFCSSGRNKEGSQEHGETGGRPSNRNVSVWSRHPLVSFARQVGRRKGKVASRGRLHIARAKWFAIGQPWLWQAFDELDCWTVGFTC